MRLNHTITTTSIDEVTFSNISEPLENPYLMELKEAIYANLDGIATLVNRYRGSNWIAFLSFVAAIKLFIPELGHLIDLTAEEHDGLWDVLSQMNPNTSNVTIDEYINYALAYPRESYTRLAESKTVTDLYQVIANRSLDNKYDNDIVLEKRLLVKILTLDGLTTLNFTDAQWHGLMELQQMALSIESLHAYWKRLMAFKLLVPSRFESSLPEPEVLEQFCQELLLHREMNRYSDLMKWYCFLQITFSPNVEFTSDGLVLSDNPMSTEASIPNQLAY